MHEFVSLNSKIMPAASAQAYAASAGALYGKGVFTTLRIYDGERDDRWREHWLRLSRDSARLGIDMSSLDVARIGDDIDELARCNEVSDARARVTIIDEGPTELWPVDRPRQLSVLIMTGDIRTVPANFRLGVSPFSINSTSPLAGVKSCNYLDKIIARTEARKRGFDECIQLNERGEIASAIMANVFWRKDGKLFTPSLKTGCVPGTTRMALMETFQCTEVEAQSSEIEFADEIFLTSAGIGVVQVLEFNGRALKGEGHEITSLSWKIGERKNTRNRCDERSDLV